MEEYKTLSYFGGLIKYIDNLKMLAKDDKRLLDKIYDLTILFWILDCSCGYDFVSEDQKQCIINMIKTIINTNESFCLPEFNNKYYSNVNTINNYQQWHLVNSDGMIVEKYIPNKISETLELYET